MRSVVIRRRLPVRIVPLFVPNWNVNENLDRPATHLPPVNESRVPLLELQQSFGALGAHRFAEVSERYWIGEIQLLAVVVSQDPREYRVLHQVIVTTAC